MLQFSDLTIETAVANKGGAMEAETISKSRASTKSHTSRGNIMQKIFLFIAVFYVSIASAYAQQRPLTDQLFNTSPNKERELLRNFEKRMIDRGFTKRIVPYDFLSEYEQKHIKDFSLHLISAGIWINDREKLVALRLTGNSWKEIVIPFNEFQSATISNEDIYTNTTGYVGPLGGIHVSSNSFSTGLQISIVTDNISSGTQVYTLELFELPRKGTSTSGEAYKDIMRCAQSIVAEINSFKNRAALPPTTASADINTAIGFNSDYRPLTAKGRKVYDGSRELKRDDVRWLMRNTEAQWMYEKSKDESPPKSHFSKNYLPSIF